MIATRRGARQALVPDAQLGGLHIHRHPTRPGLFLGGGRPGAELLAGDVRAIHSNREASTSRTTSGEG
ncbi:hypothetical protein AB0N28_16360 [Streptomyces sp. NPDC051130]|uniref:hypothetical protein n=1 Tax=Streptomyces sp. NPDC051130 TaxID=3157223 RepID=UPI00341C0E69